MSEEDRVRWDARHSGHDPARGGDAELPKPFRPFAATFPTEGIALELACGRGEAAAWLARRGLTVRGYDISAVAIAQARELAERCGVSDRCHFETADLDDGIPPGPPVNVLICNRFRSVALDSAIVERLAPGGILAISALSEVGARPGRYRVIAGELARAFTALEPIAGDESHGEAWLLARRP